MDMTFIIVDSSDDSCYVPKKLNSLTTRDPQVLPIFQIPVLRNSNIARCLIKPGALNTTGPNAPGNARPFDGHRLSGVRRAVDAAASRRRAARREVHNMTDEQFLETREDEEVTKW